jgi:predicted RNA methylase
LRAEIGVPASVAIEPMRIEYHRTLLADRVRNAAFHAALQRVIVPGETTVADIGAGTGFLGFLAAKLGAARVDLYETAEIAAVARKLLRHNRLANARIAQVHSTEVAEPERVDVVVCETLGNYPFEENIIATLNDARARYLDKGGVIIPHRIEQLVDFVPAKAMSLNNIYVRWFEAGDLLEGGAAAKAWDEVVFDRRNKTTRAGEAAWRIDRPTTIYGLALWWRAELVPGIALSTGPLDPRTHWEQLYLPLLEPIEAAAGEAVAITIRSRSTPEAGTHLAWTASALDRSGKARKRQALDLDKGFLP